MESMTAEPPASALMAYNGWGETVAAHRFFDNAKVDCRAILEPHWSKRRRGWRQSRRCYACKTLPNWISPASKLRGWGHSSTKPSVDVCALVLCGDDGSENRSASSDARMWAREPRGKDGQRGGPKESLLWIEGYERLAEVESTLPSPSNVLEPGQLGSVMSSS